MSENTIPNTVVIDPNNPSPGSNVAVTVILNEVTSVNQSVSISSSPSGFFATIPASFTVLADNDRGAFAATVSNSATGSGTVTASCNGGHAEGNCTATPL